MSKFKFSVLLPLVAMALCLQFATVSASPQEDDHSCWGSDKPCQDGKYRDYEGKEQPAKCDNFKTGTAETHDCACERATTCKHDAKMGPKCSTYCRPDACKCVKDCS